MRQEIKIRKLKADEIECRVSTVSEKGVSLLLYKDARVDMRILDETFGNANWKRSHKMIGDNLYCTVEIYDEVKQEWISKEDVGVESYTEKQKGQASDSFKRACFNVGIGRELYTAPFIWIGKEDVKIVPGRNGNLTTYDRFKVGEIEYTDGKISYLTIANAKTEKIVYSYGSKVPRITEKEAEVFKAVCESKGKTPKEGFEKMSPAEYAKALKALENV